MTLASAPTAEPTAHWMPKPVTTCSTCAPSSSPSRAANIDATYASHGWQRVVAVQFEAAGPAGAVATAIKGATESYFVVNEHLRGTDV